MLFINGISLWIISLLYGAVSNAVISVHTSSYRSSLSGHIKSEYNNAFMLMNKCKVAVNDAATAAIKRQ